MLKSFQFSTTDQKMILACRLVLFRIPRSLPKKHNRDFSHSFSALKYPRATNQILRRCFCEKPEDLYAAINTEDFEMYEEKSNHKNVDIEKIADGNQEAVTLLKRIQLEIDIYAQEGGRVPNEITSGQWMELLSIPTKSQRIHRVENFWKREKRKNFKKQKQALYHKELDEYKATQEPRQLLTTSSPVEYGLLKTTLFHRFYDSDMKNLYNFRLLQAEQYGPHLIIDCGFEEYMNQRDLSYCVKDILKSWSRNRSNCNPFDMHFCNLNKNSNLFSKLSDVLPAIERDPACPFNYTDKHYLDLYPKEQLVYLTPHSKEEMKSFEGDSIYIIGGLNDRSNEMALTLAKAKKEGIRKLKFPLDKYIKWCWGKKTLSVTECVEIMNNLKDGKSWDFALRYIRERQMNPPNFTGGMHDEYGDPGVGDKAERKAARKVEQLIQLRCVYDTLIKKK